VRVKRRTSAVDRPPTSGGPAPIRLARDWHAPIGVLLIASAMGTGLSFVGPAVGQIATVIGPTIIGPAVIGNVVVSAG
jgi:hypothetical protein